RPDDLACYSSDASIAVASGTPAAAVFPTSTAEVSDLLRQAAQSGQPVVTRGAGSGLAGGATPSPGALLLVLTRMQRMTIDPQQHEGPRPGPGPPPAAPQAAAESHGLLSPPAPPSMTVSTIGGNIACNAGGPRCLKYGVTADYVLGLTAVLADGTVVQVGDGL